MFDPLLAGTVAGLLGVVALAAGFVLFTRGRAAWVPGYDPSTSAVPEGALARYVGTAVVQVGVVALVLALVLATGYGRTVVWTGIALWIVVAVLWNAYKVRGLLAKYDDGMPADATAPGGDPTRGRISLPDPATRPFPSG